MLSFGVFGSTFAIRICCAPVFAKSPYASTVVSEPSEPSAADWTAGGIAGSAGFAAAAGSLGFSAGLFSQPDDDTKGSSRNNIGRPTKGRGTELITLPDERRDTL